MRGLWLNRIMQKGGNYKIQGTKIWSPYPVELTPGERRLLFSLQRFFDSEMIFADFYLPKVDRVEKTGTARVMAAADLLQIDGLTVNENGVFVFESKDYVGWIYGHGERTHWTQVAAYGKNKYQFYSPVRQNMRHVEAVRAVVGDKVPVFSVIVFGREATLKVIDGLPEDCFVCTQANLGTTLKGVSGQKVLTTQEIEKTRQMLMAGRVFPNRTVREEHVAEVEAYERKVSER